MYRVHYLNKISPKGTSLFTEIYQATDNMSEAEAADRVIVMDGGRVAMDGTPREVFAQVDRLRSMGLTAPDTVDVLYRLRENGWSVPLDTLTVEECADTIVEALAKETQ